MPTWRSNEKDGRYMELTITESIDPINNRSTLYWTVTSGGPAALYVTVAETYVYINGVQVYYNPLTDYSTRVYPAKVGSRSGSINVDHNPDGTKSIYVSFTTRVYYWDALEYGGQYQLTNIDRTPPVVSFGASNITSNSFKISATSSAVADAWWYRLGPDQPWVSFGSEGTASQVTVTGLAPDTTYAVQVRARKKYNAVNGDSAASNVKTLGGAVINSASTITADAATVNVAMNVTAHDASWYHKLAIKNGETTILTTAAFQMTAGTSDRTVTLTAAERTALLTAMANVKSFTATLALTTYTDAECQHQLGYVSSKNCLATTTEAASAPLFTTFSYVDTRGLVGAITGNPDDNVILVQSFSDLLVTAVAGTARNCATIKSYSASIGTASKTSTTTSIAVGAVDTHGDSVQLTVSCIDSRGYIASVNANVKILKYERPKMSSFTLRRKDDIEDIIQLSFFGTISSLKPDGTTEINNLKYAGFYYKQTSEETWSSYCSILADVSETGTSFTFSTEQLMETPTVALSLDPELSYDFHLVIRDQLDSYASLDMYEVITQGIPHITTRKRNATYGYPRIGVNNPNPVEPFDIIGNIRMNGSLVQGYVGEIGDTSFDAIIKGGVYGYDGASGAYSAPVEEFGVLEVLKIGSNVVQRFTAFGTDVKIYNRAWKAATEQWSAWAQAGGSAQPQEAYPVNSVYISVNSLNPANALGYGTWVQIKDRFILAAGDTYTSALATGGSSVHNHATQNHTLTAAQMPWHQHAQYAGWGGVTGSYTGSDRFCFGRNWAHNNIDYHTLGQGGAGGSQPHHHGNVTDSNHMPPYIVVYVWYRTA